MKLVIGLFSLLALANVNARADDYGNCYYDGSCNGAACCVGGRCVYSPGPCRVPETKRPTAAMLKLLPKVVPQVSACSYGSSLLKLN